MLPAFLLGRTGRQPAGHAACPLGSIALLAAFQQGLGLVYSDAQGALGLLEQSLASFREALRLDAGLRSDATHNAEMVKRWLQLIGQQLAKQKAAGAGQGPPASGQGAAIDAILGKDKGIRSAAGAKVRPMAVGKDW